MDKAVKNTDSTVPAPARVGALGKLTAVLGGAAAGIGGMVLAVEAAIRKNLMQTKKDGFAELEKFGDELRNDDSLVESLDAVHDLRMEARKRFKDGYIAEIADESLRQAVSNKNTVLGRAIRTSRQAQQLDPQADVVLKTVLERGLEFGAVNIQSDLSRLVVHDEKLLAEGMLREAAHHVPLSKKLGLSSELLISGRQKALAVSAFAAVAAVTAGAIMYVFKSHAHKKNDRAAAAEAAQDLSIF